MIFVSFLLVVDQRLTFTLIVMALTPFGAYADSWLGNNLGAEIIDSALSRSGVGALRAVARGYRRGRAQASRVTRRAHRDDRRIMRDDKRYGIVPRTTKMRFAGTTRFHALNCMEFKFLDKAISIGLTTSTEKDELINGIPRGDASDERIGQKAFVSSAQVKVTVMPNLVNTVNPSVVDGHVFTRCMLVLDRQSNLEDFTTNDNVMQKVLTAVGGETVFSESAPRALDETRRFWVIYDKVICNTARICTDAVATATKWIFQPVIIRVYKKFHRPIRTNFTIASSSGAATTIQDNGLWFCVMCCEKSVNPTTVLGTARIRFTD